MRFLINFAILLGGSVATLKVDEGYHVLWDTVQGLPEEALSYHARENPHVPLLNATLDCRITHDLLWQEYWIRGYDWHGILEEDIKHAAKVPGAMTKWKFRFGEHRDCYIFDRGTRRECTDWRYGWEASFRLPFGSYITPNLESELNKLLGAVGNLKHKDPAYREVTWMEEWHDGSEVREGSPSRAYPPKGQMVKCEQWEAPGTEFAPDDPLWAYKPTKEDLKNEPIFRPASKPKTSHN